MLILVTWTRRTQTERVWQSSVVNTSTTSCCHQRHTHEPVGGDRERLPFSQNEYLNIGPTITVHLKMPDKNSSSSQILRFCAQWEHRLDSLPAQVGSDTRTTRQHHRPTPMPPHAAIMWTAVWLIMCMKNTRQYTPGKHEAFIQCCFNVGPPSSTLAQH